MEGLLIAFEGLDQSGKQTQAELLRDRFVEAGRLVHLLTFPAYETEIGAEIGRALRGERQYGAEVMQLLYIANRYERKPQLERERSRGAVIICDRYLASSVAYGEAQGLDAAWLLEIQKNLPQPDITFLLDIAPEVSARRKTADRDRFEQDLPLLERVRKSYLRMASGDGWVHLDANRERTIIGADVHAAMAPLLTRFGQAL